MTAKQRVIKRWRKAFCRKNIMGSFTVFYGVCPGMLGVGKSPIQAWANAANTL